MSNPELTPEQKQVFRDRLVAKVPRNCLGCVVAGEFVEGQMERVNSGIPIELAEARVAQINRVCKEGLIFTLPAVGIGPLERQCSNVQSERPDMPNS